MMLLASAFLSLWSAFATPPAESRPWCYWWWVNGHADRETITADLESMRRLGFGGILMIDSRGYWENDEHVVNPKAELVWGTEGWYDLVEFSIRECARLGLEFTMNASASGGTLNGFIDGKEYETDVMNRDEVVAHLDRAVGPLLKRVPELVGTTFTHIYSVSYEGSVKTGGSWSAIKDTFYATMKDWAHSHGLKVFSESGGPWAFGAKAAKLDCDQLDLLAHNDFPQGEFWVLDDCLEGPFARHANRGGRFYQRAAVLSARREGRSIVSLEAFTHMLRHWSVEPSTLKPLADIAFVDGANRLVWHTYSCSPKKFGVPGAEYFAGTHINGNVTWHDDAVAFINYLWRCQAMLQRGEYVDDGEFVNVSTNYHGWGRYRQDDKAQFTTTHRREGDADWFFVVGEGKGDVVLNASSEGRVAEIWDPVTMTRKVAAAEALQGGKTRVELDLPVGGSAFVVFAPRSFQTGLKEVGEKSWSSRKEHSDLQLQLKTPTCITMHPVTNAWNVSFAYHRGISAAPPAPVTMETLRDWTSFGEDGKAASTELRYFSGAATYRTVLSVRQSDSQTIKQSNNAILSLGELPTGLAHVFVNGKDCGVVWCAPWEADVTSALREGENEIEIRYTNNWYNRLVGDCFLPAENRVTRSTVHYWNVPRRKPESESRWPLLPTIHSGPSVSDKLQPSGLLGPVSLVFRGKCAAPATPWVAEEERALVMPMKVQRIERTPVEQNPIRFWTNETGFVEINYDESKAGVLGKDYEIPDPLVFADGRKVASAADWAERRKEILDVFEREVYGRMPPKPDAMVFELVSEKITEDRFATERRYRQWFRADKSGPCVDWIVFVPRHAKKPCPVILHLNYKGNDLIASGRTNHFVLPLGEFAARGYAFMSANYKQMSSDGPGRPGEPLDGLFALWGARDPKRTDNTGAIMAWAWGLCRGLDLAERVPEIDASRSVVVGSSRLGKAALLAAAFDERFAGCVANQTGAVGVQLMKRDFGESIAAQRLMFPWWYCQGLWKWAGREREMPFDQHMLLACVAPRALLLECYDKKWFDPQGEWLAAQAAAPVWRALGADVAFDGVQPEPYDAVAAVPPFGYVRRTEEHGLSPYDWKWALDFADRTFSKQKTKGAKK